jgi:hypothetical protein
MANPADDRTVLRRGLVICAWTCCALVVASFALFAQDQISGASKHQAAEIASGSPTTTGVTPTSAHHGSVRRFIDDAAHALTAPFRAIFQPSSAWGYHIFDTVGALLLYGLGLGYLARYSSGLS